MDVTRMRGQRGGSSRRRFIASAFKGLMIGAPFVRLVFADPGFAYEECSDQVVCSLFNCECDGNDSVCLFECFDAWTDKYCYAVEQVYPGGCCPN